MNIGKLAQLAKVSPDTLRYYERDDLLDAPTRGANGYRRYTEDDLTRVRFVRSAQALGFSLSQIRSIIPQLKSGQMDRGQVEGHLRTKIAEIDAQMRQLRDLKRELLATFAALKCEPGAALSMQAATAPATPRPGRAGMLRGPR